MMRNKKYVSHQFRYLRYAMVFVGAGGLLWLWTITIWGRYTIATPGWLAILITLLPFLYMGLFIYCIFLILIVKKKAIALILVGCVCLSVLILWGAEWFPGGSKPGADDTPLRILAWNVQRMGEFDDRGSIPNKIACVANLVKKESPDLLALLEITKTQLTELQQQLGISKRNCEWSDYYGTGKKRRAGLAACVVNKSGHWVINQKQKLNLPPKWKYIFIEVLKKSDPQIPPINFLALHVAPPKIEEADLKEIFKNLMKRTKKGIHQLQKLISRYEEQVSLQARQTNQALNLVKKFKDPTIISGDFNSTSDAVLHVNLRRYLTDTWAKAGMGFGATRYWAGVLPLRIDYIYVTKTFSANKSITVVCDCSDHLPLVSEVFLD
jgi:endonuclease/exonuclease/phosphatase family metal-dependent hydrolase